MNISNSITDVREYVSKWKLEGLKIGFVPTMGYLHEGHKSLIDRAVKENDRVVVSIFVNPTQFGPKEDLANYPRDLERDASLCSDSGVDLIFAPEVDEMYFDDFCSFVDMEGLTKGLCGKSRPIHFRGVCTIVCKLFNIVSPDNAYFGEKDAQQLAVIKRMVRDLNFNVNIIGCPIVRENDGLAKSSRNTYLNDEERKAATILNKALKLGKEALDNGLRECSELVDIINKEIQLEPLAKVDYVEVVDSSSMGNLDIIKNNVLVAIAVYIGKTRLIDNFTYEI
ncbi:pantoate--beta-alanine ligase [Clostridium paraputrificum]|uniref:pantoate--beta-alanine ligase n=1 Tax=Clostridium paraputrificum TaxID=29363 RepID=UPI00325ADA98